MKAVVISELGGAPLLAERPEPHGDAIYAVSAVSLNPIDINVSAGRYFAGHPEFPYVPGAEAVGRDASGSRVYLFGDGLGIVGDGFLAERVAARRDLGVPLPDDVSDEVATSCGIAGMAGWMPVAWRARVRPDDRVLVLGATGTVGLIAVQAAKLLGAARVVAAGRNGDRLERAKQLGADAVVRLDEDDLSAAFAEATEGGPTLVVDMLWGEPARAAMAAAAQGWRWVQVGQSSGPDATIASAAVRGKMGELLGFTDFAVAPDVYRSEYLKLVAHAAAGRIVFDIQTYVLADVADAWARQAAGAAAKLVVTI